MAAGLHADQLWPGDVGIKAHRGRRGQPGEKGVGWRQGKESCAPIEGFTSLAGYHYLKT